MKRYYVYVLLCADRSFYIGVTNNLEERVAQHQFGEDEESYTYSRRPVKLVHCSEFQSVNDAIAWEKQMKGWSRAKKAAFISNNFNLVHDLSRCTNKTGSRRKG